MSDGPGWREKIFGRRLRYLETVRAIEKHGVRENKSVNPQEMGLLKPALGLFFVFKR